MASDGNRYRLGAGGSEGKSSFVPMLLHYGSAADGDRKSPAPVPCFANGRYAVVMFPMYVWSWFKTYLCCCVGLCAVLVLIASVVSYFV